MNIWNTICKDILDKKQKQVTEKEYQELVYTHFRYLLGWYCERVEKQYQLRVGSTVNNVYPDMVFFKNENPVFVIEMKKPNHIQSKEEVIQLFSYMKLLPVQIGIYIGEHIELFYYDFSKEPISVLKIDFVTDSNNGKCLVDLFKQENFKIEQIISFCKQQIENKEKENKINKFIDELLTDTGKQLISELLTSRLFDEGYSVEDITKITNEIEIKILRKKQFEKPVSKETILTTPNSQKKDKKDKTHYKLNGSGNFGKGRLALAIVKLFVENNPHLTFYEIKNKIPFGIEEYSAIQKWKETTPDKYKDNRYREEKENLMISADGVTFAFTREIGRGNIGKIIKFGEEQGFLIEPIR